MKSGVVINRSYAKNKGACIGSKDEELGERGFKYAKDAAEILMRRFVR